MEALSLYELNALVRQVLERQVSATYWVQAELSDVRVNASGHCYVEFVQKSPRGNALVAKARGTIWANVFQMLKPYFEEATGQAFAPGIKVLVCVSVSFHELYGYSLMVHDIDPAYTLGDLAQRRREILRQLEEEGVLTLNKELPMPLLPRRVAVISSPTAAGYGDFRHQLEHNPRGYYFQVELFPAVMQGDAVEVFLSPDGNLKRYMELEVSPNGVRFYGEITNEDGKTPQLKKTKPQFDAEAMRTEYGYRVSIRLPFTALEGFDRSKMKLNAFCLDKMFGGQQKLYALNPTRCDSFHRPKFFIGEAEK